MDRFESELQSRRSVVAIVGLGYVGLPLVVACVTSGFRVIGFDIDEERVAQLNRGQSPINSIDDELIGRMVSDGKFAASKDFSELNGVDVIIICVPTPLTKNREPDLSFVISTAGTVAKYIRKGQLIVLESTTWPGTTSEVVRPILEKSGLRSGVDFFLAFSPEREDPGNQTYSTKSIPKIVGGEDQEATRMAAALYACIVDRVVNVTGSRTAEAVKLTENIFRAVNIALVNELKVIFNAMEIDVWEVIEAASTKPFGYMPFYPGPGLGGHCIPIDPFYLTWKAREYDIATRFIELAGEINAGMPGYVVSQLILRLNAMGRSMNGARIILFGVAYKKNVEDIRESPALRLMEMIERLGAVTEFYDPFVPVLPLTREHPNLAGKVSQEWRRDLAAEYSASLIVTDHDDFDYDAIVSYSPIILDTRNACARRGLARSNVFKS